MRSEAEKRAQQKYNEKVKKFSVRLNIDNPKHAKIYENIKKSKSFLKFLEKIVDI